MKGSPLEGKKLDLEFPCPWTYTIFGADEDLLRAAAAEVVGAAQHTLEFSNASKTGKYRSFHLVVIVTDDKHRLAIFRELHGHPDVAYVL